MGESTSTKNAPKNSWFVGLKQEFRKAIWPDKESLGKQTLAVVGSTVVIGLIIAGFDVLIQQLLDLIIKF